MQRRRSVNTSSIVCIASLVFLAVACSNSAELAADPAPSPGGSTPVGVQAIGGVDRFAKLFDADQGVVRLVLLLSPT